MKIVDQSDSVDGQEVKSSLEDFLEEQLDWFDSIPKPEFPTSDLLAELLRIFGPIAKKPEAPAILSDREQTIQYMIRSETFLSEENLRNLHDLYWSETLGHFWTKYCGVPLTTEQVLTIDMRGYDHTVQFDEKVSSDVISIIQVSEWNLEGIKEIKIHFVVAEESSDTMIRIGGANLVAIHSANTPYPEDVADSDSEVFKRCASITLDFLQHAGFDWNESAIGMVMLDELYIDPALREMNWEGPVLQALLQHLKQEGMNVLFIYPHMTDSEEVPSEEPNPEEPLYIKRMEKLLKELNFVLIEKEEGAYPLYMIALGGDEFNVD